MGARDLRWYLQLTGGSMIKGVVAWLLLVAVVLLWAYAEKRKD